MSIIRSLFFRRSTSSFPLLLAGFMFLIGMILLTCFGPVNLSCNRINPNQVNCSLTQFVAFGFIKVREINLIPLKQAKVDEQVKHTIETAGNSPSGLVEKKICSTEFY